MKPRFSSLMYKTGSPQPRRYKLLSNNANEYTNGDTVSEARIHIGGIGSMALAATEAENMLRGAKLTDDLIAQAAATVFKPSKAMDNTDHEASWRKKMAPIYLARALRACLSPRP